MRDNKETFQTLKRKFCNRYRICAFPVDFFSTCYSINVNNEKLSFEKKMYFVKRAWIVFQFYLPAISKSKYFVGLRGISGSVITLRKIHPYSTVLSMISIFNQKENGISIRKWIAKTWGLLGFTNRNNNHSLPRK